MPPWATVQRAVEWHGAWRLLRQRPSLYVDEAVHSVEGLPKVSREQGAVSTLFGIRPPAPHRALRFPRRMGRAPGVRGHFTSNASCRRCHRRRNIRRLEVAAVTGEVQGPKRIQWRSRHIRAIGFARRLQGAHAPEGRNRPRGEAGDDVGAPVASGVPDSRLQGPNPPEETDGPSSKAADEIGGPVASGEPDSRSRSGWRHTTGPTWLLAVGLILWLISQALPATQPMGIRSRSW
jgi:hypothetical protein